MTGWVNVGLSRDTAQFAVESIRRWWNKMGKARYPHAHELLITADGGGSNGYRTRLWKSELQKLANGLKLTIRVCHFPPGTSKWKKIEHRMFRLLAKIGAASPWIVWPPSSISSLTPPPTLDYTLKRLSIMRPMKKESK
jgi:Rhodopirellula transposase DDE domain